MCKICPQQDGRYKGTPKLSSCRCQFYNSCEGLLTPEQVLSGKERVSLVGVEVGSQSVSQSSPSVLPSKGISELNHKTLHMWLSQEISSLSLGGSSTTKPQQLEANKFRSRRKASGRSKLNNSVSCKVIAE